MSTTSSTTLYKTAPLPSHVGGRGPPIFSEGILTWWQSVQAKILTLRSNGVLGSSWSDGQISFNISTSLVAKGRIPLVTKVDIHNRAILSTDANVVGTY